jgi:hypothetical protein
MGHFAELFFAKVSLIIAKAQAKLEGLVGLNFRYLNIF